MRNQRFFGDLMLILTAFIWGSSFVSQSVSMDHIGPFTFNAIRCIIGGLVLIPVILIMNKIEGDKTTNNNKQLILGGILCGIVLFIGSTFQQIGIAYTTVGKAGFITALYIVIVPLSGILFKKKLSPKILISVLIALIGLYLLSITEDFSIGKGDFLVLLGSLFFSAHILLIDYFSPKVNGVKMSCIQFLLTGTISLFPMFILEDPKVTSILSASSPILYSGVLSCGIAYTLQIIAQKKTEPTVASLLLSLESVFAVISGWIVLGEALSFRELTGCILMFISIILAQIPNKNWRFICNKYKSI